MKSFVETLRKLWADPMGKIGMVGVFLLLAMAVCAPLIAPYPYDQIGMRFQSPSGEHLFGTDKFGRDIFSRVLYGAQVSIQVGVIAVGIGAVFGYLLGLAAGYFEGVVDRVIMCVMDVLFAFPSILLAIFISAVLGKASALRWWPSALSIFPCFAGRCARRSFRPRAWNTSKTPRAWA